MDPAASLDHSGEHTEPSPGHDPSDESRSETDGAGNPELRVEPEDQTSEPLMRRASDPNDPDTWIDRMNAEHADISARADANDARYLHDLADREVPGTPEAYEARLRAEQADLLARISAERADYLWEMAGGRPEDPAAGASESLTAGAEPVQGGESNASAPKGELPPAADGAGDGGKKPPLRPAAASPSPSLATKSQRPQARTRHLHRTAGTLRPPARVRSRRPSRV